MKPKPRVAWVTAQELNIECHKEISNAEQERTFLGETGVEVDRGSPRFCWLALDFTDQLQSDWGWAIPQIEGLTPRAPATFRAGDKRIGKAQIFRNGPREKASSCPAIYDRQNVLGGVPSPEPRPYERLIIVGEGKSKARRQSGSRLLTQAPCTTRRLAASESPATTHPVYQRPQRPRRLGRRPTGSDDLVERRGSAALVQLRTRSLRLPFEGVDASERLEQPIRARVLQIHPPYSAFGLDFRTCICFTTWRGSTAATLPRPLPVERVSGDLHAVHGAIPEPRRLPRLPQREVPSGRLRLPQMWQDHEVPSAQESSGVLLPVLRAPGLSHGRHDLPQVHDEPPNVVLGDLPNEQHPLRDQREAAGTRDWGELPNCPPDVQADSDLALSGRRPDAHRGSRSGRVSGRRSGPGFGSREGTAHVRAKVSHRPTIWAAVERGGRVRSKVVKSRGTLDVEGAIYEHVLPSSMIFTDEWLGYDPDRLGARYRGHYRIRHEDKIYVRGNVHTQTVEGFFGLLKNGIRGVYHSVSSRYLQSYLDEYAFRYNARGVATPMFFLILDQVRKADLASS